jgi:hypothetical protein
VQYYRASSFSLSLDTYNNTGSLISNQSKDNSTAPPVLVDTPLPTGLNMTFLSCVNATIGLSIPLIEIDSNLAGREAKRTLIIVLSIGGAALFLLAAICLFVKLSKPKRAHDAVRLANLPPAIKSDSRPHWWTKKKSDKLENRGRYSSLGMPGNTSPPESQNLAVNKE